MTHDALSELANGFVEIDRQFLHPRHWHIIIQGKWLYKEIIMRTEGRALVLAVRHELRSIKNFGKNYLCLVDNLGLALSASKGRGKQWISNSTCRELAALCLATNSRLHIRWVPSELNIADAPSRQLPDDRQQRIAQRHAAERATGVDPPRGEVEVFHLPDQDASSEHCSESFATPEGSEGDGDAGLEFFDIASRPASPGRSEAQSHGERDWSFEGSSGEETHRARPSCDHALPLQAD